MVEEHDVTHTVAGEPVPPLQQDDSGLLSLLMMAQYHGLRADPAKLRHEYGHGSFDTITLLHAAKSLGFSAKLVRQPAERLHKAPLPCLAVDTDGRFFILAKVDTSSDEASQSSPNEAPPSTVSGSPRQASRLLIQRPGEPPSVVTQAAFAALWSGELIFLTSKASFAGEVSRFDFTWFIPAVVKYRKLLGEVLMVSFVLQLVGLITPLFFQVVMDKVLVNHALQTLNVIAIGLLCATVFEALLTGIRTYVFAHTSSKIDAELGARLFRHLLALPMAYFQSRRVGDSVARIRELENIRSFLTGNAMTLVLDLMFSVVFIAVMLWYSRPLTLIVVGSIPVYVILSFVFTPMLRARLNEKFNRGAENQAFLVETISGIDTVKAMAVEPRWQQRWDKQLASYVAASLSTTNIATVASNGVTLVSKLVTLGIMWMGASLVIDGQLTVGELIAFNMLAGQVSSPILRMAQLWNDFQQVGISMSRLGDILNVRTEIEGNKTRIPRLAGAIEFDQVSFRYRPDAPDVIRGMQLRIRPGEVIGIVGRSGSGKSTLAKLIQRLYVPDRGRVLVDGQDIAIIDTASLRHQIGVVLQENVLFNRSVRDNIALLNPTAPIEHIIQVAKLAGAHEFICELPEGYDTLVGEHGTGLSGGQRQRIAIARALIGDPRILIFDEATSALDYESEKIIQDNMRLICRGRTVIIIAHRLSAVRDAHRIVVMERGQIAEMGSHTQLLSNPRGIYSHLHRLQQGGQQPATSGAPAPAPEGVA
ncbi:cyclolysin secretion/processing ATP-binding protein CyaB [Alicycliphilus denitrificans]|uniref:type I secretion system permease/ATPase n=1 Tax=Alicycliphilus denitrificans TaxID=179636 RepID=UPI00095CBE63|nr:type I secretion system permease/ATPase [Alicycliphilus denitrificans]MBN9575227.1 type I secretion system permease/ATPase [Alicycliphilus denitrificans]OJW83726.1 MAG: peptidase C39 [Alicycliphilus sp. 69-12]BCN38575.1 cyclolysin secretion/processing ATP-binding protein CyaB [Alicycliphilus denitrificans]